MSVARLVQFGNVAYWSWPDMRPSQNSFGEFAVHVRRERVGDIGALRTRAPRLISDRNHQKNAPAGSWHPRHGIGKGMNFIRAP